MRVRDSDCWGNKPREGVRRGGAERELKKRGRGMKDRVDKLGKDIDSGIDLSITIDKLRVFINKTLSILSAYQ